jgi:hypothetical protein
MRPVDAALNVKGIVLLSVSSRPAVLLHIDTLRRFRIGDRGRANFLRAQAQWSEEKNEIDKISHLEVEHGCGTRGI